MALNAKDIPITRTVVAQWLADYKESGDPPPQTIEQFLADRLQEVDLLDTHVNTLQHESLGDTTSLLNMILEDLPSYGFENR